MSDKVIKPTIYLIEGCEGICLSVVHPDSDDWENYHFELVDATRPKMPLDIQMPVLRNVLARLGNIQVELL